MYTSTSSLKRKEEDLIQLKLTSEFKVTLNSSKERMMELANIATSNGLLAKWESLRCMDSDLILSKWWFYFMKAKSMAQLWLNDIESRTLDASTAFEYYARAYAPPELAVIKSNCRYYSETIDLERHSKMYTTSLVSSNSKKLSKCSQATASITSDKTLSKELFKSSANGVILTDLLKAEDEINPSQVAAPETSEPPMKRRRDSPSFVSSNSDVMKSPFKRIETISTRVKFPECLAQKDTNTIDKRIYSKSPILISSHEKTVTDQIQLTDKLIQSTPLKPKRRIQTIPAARPEDSNCMPWSSSEFLNRAERIRLCSELGHPNTFFGICNLCERVHCEEVSLQESEATTENL